VYSDIFDEQGPGRRRRLLTYDQRRSFHALRRRVAPIVTSLLAITVIVLGVIGFQEPPLSLNFGNSLFRSFQLFGFGGGVGDHPNAWLQVARFLGPAIVGYAAIRGVIALYREHFDVARIRFLRGHVVIAGLGDTGFRMATAVDRENHRVVVIESDPANPAIEGCRERGILVVKGDAKDPAVLERAGILNAALLVVTCGEDATNVDIAAAARGVAKSRQGAVLTVLVEVDDLELWHIMKAPALLDRYDAAMRLEVFNLSALAAEMVLARHPAFDATATGRAHVLLVGAQGIAPHLVLDIVREWQRTTRRELDSLRVTVAGDTADGDLKRIVAKYPGIDAVPGCELKPWNVDLRSAWELRDVPYDVTAVYVCLASETESLARTIALRELPALRDVEFVIPVADEEAGVGAAVKRDLPMFERVHAFGVLSTNLARAALERTTTEKIAKLSHDLHLATTQPDPDDPSLLPWDDPRFLLRESDRMYADGLGKKLAELNCMVVPAPLANPAAPGFDLSDAEVEQLAPAEHERWVKDMKRLGYRRGSPKDHVAKRHPMIDVPYDELPKENKDKDRNHVRAMVEILAHVGFRIERLADGRGGATGNARPSESAPREPSARRT
jgi:hypothetical protein